MHSVLSSRDLVITRLLKSVHFYQSQKVFVFFFCGVYRIYQLLLYPLTITAGNDENKFPCNYLLLLYKKRKPKSTSVQGKLIAFL